MWLYKEYVIYFLWNEQLKCFSLDIIYFLNQFVCLMSVDVLICFDFSIFRKNEGENIFQVSYAVFMCTYKFISTGWCHSRLLIFLDRQLRLEYSFWLDLVQSWLLSIKHVLNG